MIIINLYSFTFQICDEHFSTCVYIDIDICLRGRLKKLLEIYVDVYTFSCYFYKECKTKFVFFCGVAINYCN